MDHRRDTHNRDTHSRVGMVGMAVMVEGTRRRGGCIISKGGRHRGIMRMGGEGGGEGLGRGFARR